MKPLVTVAIPLYKGGRFVERICDNIARLDYPNLEIIVSDRHSADNAIERISARFPDHPTLRFVQANDEINWVAHYNSLLQMAAGDYFMWMPQDDWFPTEYIPRLVTGLEQNPMSVVAFGRVLAIHTVGNSTGSSLLGEGFLPDPPMVQNEHPSAKLSLRLYLFWGIGIPFRGLFRRSQLLSILPEMPMTYKVVAADNIWLFGLTLHAKIHYMPDVFCHKYVYDDSTSVELVRQTQWYDVVPRRLDEFRVLAQYIIRARLPLMTTLYSLGILWLYVVYKIGRIFYAVMCDAFPIVCRILPRTERFWRWGKLQIRRFLDTT